MATNTDIENSLIAKISDVNLRTSLALIRESVIAIWKSETRIIKDFTDHGFDHCLRLIKHASGLLEANKGTALSDEEMYLLIAAIYLHDIGMQSDVVKFPDIKNIAIDFGANFNIEINTVGSNHYAIEEQLNIRKNHHLLSAAWIDFAYRNEGTSIDKSIKSIPYDLIKDLIDICKYHSSLNILNCSKKFEIKQGRKQLIASIVRFADELDIDCNRVSIDTVKNFSVDPHNEFYWWLHYLTTIELNKNILNFTICLHPEDFNSFGSYIRKAFIEEFRKKNRDIIEILNDNNIPITINADSDVKQYEYTPKLPDEIVKVIQKMQDKTKETSSINKDIIKHEPKNNLNNFPVPKPYFAGRKTELTDLKQAFESNSFIFIEGGGGIGKTQFVAKFIEEQKLNSKIVWYECIPTSQPDDIINGAGFEELLKGKEKTEREKFSAFKDKIEENDLVVFLDNYQEVENIPVFKSFLRFINEYLKKGHIIVIGRDNIVSPNLQPKRIPLKGLGDDSLTHAQQLIKQSYHNLIDTPNEKLKTICDTLQGYPLAIDLAIYLLSLNVTAENIISVAVSEASADTNIEEISKRLLNEIFTRTDASEEEKEFLKLLSIFRGKIHKEEALSVIYPDVFEKANRKLINRNLLEFNNDFLELHPLIREFCYNELKNKKEIHQKASKFYIDKRTNKWNTELEEKIFYHLSCSEQWKDISDTIIKFGRDIILQGFLDRLQQMILLVKQKNIIESIFDIFEGDIAEIKGNWNIALESFNKAKQSPDREVSVEGLIKYGEILYRKGDVKEAQPIFEEAIKITENDINKKWYARALNDLGLVNEFFGNIKEALNNYSNSLEYRQILSELNEIASSLNNIGAIKSDLGFKIEALDYYERSLKISEEIGDKTGIANSLNNIGLIKSDFGYKRVALDYYEKSLNICKEIGDKSGIASSFNNIGAVQSDLGYKKEALGYYERSLKIREEIGDKSSIANCLNNIGAIQSNLGFKNEALDYFERSLKIKEEIGDKSGIARCFNNIGSNLFESNIDLEKASLYFLQSIALFKQIDMTDYNIPLRYLISMRKKLDKLKFNDLFLCAFNQLDVDLKNLININEILGEPIIAEKKQGRNEPCNCGSGKKYKNCHGINN